MSRMWARLLLVIIVAELLTVGGLAAWAKYYRPAHSTAKASTAPAVGTAPQPKAPKVTPVLYAGGLTKPTSIVAIPNSNDKRLFVTEQTGVIRILNIGGKLATAPLLDLSSKVNYDQAEMGLLGLAFHPNFKQNGYIYVDYNDKNKNTVIARFTVDSKTGAADLATQKILLTVAQPFSNHKGGQLAFGPDGYLYIGMGDGGDKGDPGNRAQDKSQLLGKILRIDVNNGIAYNSPASNPFAADKTAKPEIWAYGLRNPWRFSFDTKTDDLYIADVGQDAYEEVDFQKAGDKGGENYGWRCYEGSHTYNAAGCQSASSYVMPVIEYDHTAKRCSVTGGYVYRGTAQPALVGKYFYADYCGGQLYFAQQQKGAWDVTAAVSTTYSITTFGQGSDGELYFADSAAGNIYHITDAAK